MSKPHTPSSVRRIALVTGAAGGLGTAQVEALSEAGMQVVAHARTASHRLDALAERTGAIPAVRDLADPEATRALVRETVESTGRLDVLVANHATMSMSALVAADPDEWWRVVRTNLLGTFALTQEAVRAMRAHGDGGRIVIISSEWGVTGWPNASAYAASKAGLISLVKCLGRELAPEGILVNAIAPGVIDTPQLQVDADDAGVDLQTMHGRYAEGIPLGRVGHATEIAEAVRFLADPALAAMAGQIMQINGGATRGRV